MGITLEAHWWTERGEKDKFMWLIGETHPFLPRVSRERPSALPAAHLSSPASFSPPAEKHNLTVLYYQLAVQKYTEALTDFKIRVRNGQVPCFYIEIHFSSVRNHLIWSYLHVSHTGCSSGCLLSCLCFPSPSFIAVLLLWVGGNLGSPILAQQDVDNFCMALKPSMDQCTLAILISMAHLAQRGTQKDLQPRFWPVLVISWPRSALFMLSVSQNSTCEEKLWRI